VTRRPTVAVAGWLARRRLLGGWLAFLRCGCGWLK